jgi:hypothetical protein
VDFFVLTHDRVKYWTSVNVMIILLALRKSRDLLTGGKV